MSVYALKKNPSWRKGLVMTPKFRFWREKSLCDVKLQGTDGAPIETHRLILSMTSDSLAALLNGPFQEGAGIPEKSEPDIIPMHASWKTLHAILEYIYTGELEVTETTKGEFAASVVQSDMEPGHLGEGAHALQASLVRLREETDDTAG